MYKKVFKRLIDFILATTIFLIAFPVFVVVAILLTIANDGKPFFFQTRPGRYERLFKVVKFKTMNDRKGPNGELLPDAQRLTKVGSFIRKTSLDEIPQLLNVIKGDMSLIGPRPLLVRYQPYFRTEERLRFTVRPGITGLAQVSGRNMLNWDKRIALDVEYVRNLSFILDLKILVRTAINVLGSKNIVVDPESVMKNLDDERRDEFNITAAH